MNSKDQLHIAGQVAPPSKPGILPALALSAPAFAFVLASVLCVSPGPSPLMWGAFAAVAILGAAAAISYAGLARIYPTASPNNFGAIAAFFSQWPQSRAARSLGEVTSIACHFLNWVVPGLWITFAAYFAAYLLCQISSHIPVDSPWVIGLCGVVFAAGLACLALRGVRGILRIIAAACVFQIVVLLAAGFFALSHRTSSQAAGNAAWTLDSTGNPTQFVQDTMPDPTQTVPDPANPSRRIQDPFFSIPKVDPQGKPVWVYQAADAKGNRLADSHGNAIFVPTDANGKLAPLPPGAAKAVPQLFTIASPAGTNTNSQGVITYNYHVSSTSFIQPHPFSSLRNDALAQGGVAMLAMAIFQWIASIGRETKRRRKIILALAIVSPVLIAGAVCAWVHIEKAAVDQALNFFLLNASYAPPIGDVLQLVGSWAFGSPMAGWWLMLVEMWIVLLTLVLSALASFTIGANVARTDREKERFPHAFNSDEADTTPLLPQLIRAVIAANICVVGIYLFLLRFPTPFNNAYFPSPAWGPDAHALLLKLPDLLSTLLLASGLAVLLFCTSICGLYLWAIRSRADTSAPRKKIAPAVGLLMASVTIASFMAEAWVVKGEAAMESIGAIVICAAWGLGTSMIRSSRSS